MSTAHTLPDVILSARRLCRTVQQDVLMIPEKQALTNSRKQADMLHRGIRRLIHYTKQTGGFYLVRVSVRAGGAIDVAFFVRHTGQSVRVVYMSGAEAQQRNAPFYVVPGATVRERMQSWEGGNACNAILFASAHGMPTGACAVGPADSITVGQVVGEGW